MKIELDYVKVGDYYLSDLTAESYPKRGLGKYGLLRLRYLKEYRSIVWVELVMEGNLYAQWQLRGFGLRTSEPRRKT